MQKIIYILIVAAILITGSASVLAADASNPKCETVRFGTTESPGMTIKTDLAAWMLRKLGYKTHITSSTIPIVDHTLADGQIDVFLGQWLPSQRLILEKVAKTGKVTILGHNVRGGNYTLAVPQYVYDQGVTSIADLHKYKKKFGGIIYALGPGQGGTQTVLQMIKDNYADLGSWKAKKLYTAVMLTAVRKHIAKKDWVVFLGWQPHPMNVNMKIAYLSGGEQYWGPNKGQVIINTAVHSGYPWQCLNVGQFLQNYVFTVQEQSTVMQLAINGGMSNVEAGKKLIRENPKLLDRWLARSGDYQTGGIRTASGKQMALSVIKTALGVH